MSDRFIRLLIYGGTVIAAAVVVGCATRQVSDDDIVATWDDTAMTVDQFKRKMYVRYSNESNAMKKEYQNRIDIAEEYIIRDCKLKEGHRLGFDQREDIRKGYDDAVERTATELLYNAKVRDSFITEDMLREFWEHYQDEIRCRHILIKMEPEVTGRDTLSYWKRVDEVYQMARSGERFERLVDRYSEDDTIDRRYHGDLGFFKWGKMVDEFQEAAWKLKPGEISPPVRSRYGYHIIQVVERRPLGFQVHTSHIMVKISSRADPAETTMAWDRAMEILEEAKKPGADFAQLARRYSEDRKTWINGEVGWIPRGSMPSDYWDKAFTMEIGQIDGPVRTYKGYHIIKLNNNRVQTQSLDDPDMRSRAFAAISRVYSDTLNTLAEAYLEAAKAEFQSEYDQQVVKLLLRKLGDKSVPSNMNRFSALTPEEREMLVVKDNLGGLKIQDLVDMHGDHRFPPNYRDDVEFIEELVEPLIIPRYLAEIARREGYLDHPEAIAAGVKSLDNMMLPEVEREMIYNKATPTEEDIKRYYDQNIEKYTEAATATVWEIMVDDQQLAEDLMSRVEKGEDISRLARRYTMRTKTKRKGGKLGPFSRDKYGAVSRKAFELEPDGIAGPINVGETYSIIKLIEKTPEKVKTIDEARRNIEGDVRFQRQKELKAAWEAELRRAYNITVNESLLKRIWPAIKPLPEAMVAERKIWEKEREELAEKAKRKAVEDQIKLKIKPGSEQEFTTKDGKQVKVKIGEPRYVDKDGKEVDPSESKIRITPGGELKVKETPGDKGDKDKPVIRLKPKKNGD